MQIGVDIGGTFTDIVLLGDDGRLVATKVPTTPRDFLQGIAAAARRVLALAGAEAARVERFIHGTTVATNAVLEQKGGGHRRPHDGGCPGTGPSNTALQRLGARVAPRPLSASWPGHRFPGSRTIVAKVGGPCETSSRQWSNGTGAGTSLTAPRSPGPTGRGRRGRRR
ncbi:MAG: hydantoinase/oxoprolinase N-terminal domain-containing protein [Candidatus Rokuibacteriota bacterium]